MAAVLSGLRRGLRVGRATLPAGRLPQRRALSLPPPPPLPVLAIVGTPNAGKSTLFNRLVGPAQLTARAFRPRALVAPLAGTTRDRLEGEGEWLGYRFLVVDTGGIEDLWPLRAEEELARRTRRRGGGHGQGRRGRAHARRVAAGEEAGLSDEPSLDVGEAGAAGGSPSGWVGSAGAVVPPSLSPPPVSPLAAPPFAFPSAPRTEEEAEASRLRLAAAVEAQVATAVKQAAVVLFLVDARAGITAGTDRLAARLRRVAAEGGARVLVVANKCESVGAEMEAHELWGLGLGEPRAVSGLHGRGVGELLDLVVGELKEWEGKRRVQGGGGGGLGVLGEGGDGGGEVEGGSDGKGTPEGRGGHLSTHTGTEEQGRVGTATEAGTQPDALSSEDAEWGEEEGEAGEQGLAAGAPPSSVRPRPSPGWSGASSVGKVALIGRPNVGKSSLLNRLLGRERAVVDSIPGTTRDSIAEGYEWRGNKLLLLDTAGIRKPQAGGASRDDLDRASVSAARTALGQCHVALLLLDASHGITRADMAIAGLLTDQAKSCILLANKADLLDARSRAAFSESVRAKMPWLDFAPVVHTSALTGAGVDEALDTALEALAWRRARVPKRTLNELFTRATSVRPLPMVRGARLKVQYATQHDTETPTFALRLNREASLHPNDTRWIDRTIRSHWPFVATPLRILLKADPPRRSRRHALAASGPAERFVKMPKRKWDEMQKPFWRRRGFAAGGAKQQGGAGQGGAAGSPLAGGKAGRPTGVERARPRAGRDKRVERDGERRRRRAAAA